MTRILLVEPDDVTAEAVQASLVQAHGAWEITRVGTVLEAIREAGDRPFDAAVLDYELPDGSGLDILDFLRIGSPGIRIVVLSGTKSEDVAFHALSHGAGDFMVKDHHLSIELPRRVDALLHAHPVDATTALVETLTPHEYDEARFDTPPAERESSLQATIREIVGGSVIAAAVYDHRGRPLALRLLPDLEPDGLGFALATIHGQVGAVWTYGNIRPTGYAMMVDVEGGLLGITAIPGTYLVAVLFETPISRARALEKLEHAAGRLTQAMGY
jgi:DNA-binding response OmpR family regulator